MPVECGESSPRSDVKHWAKCGNKSLRYCRFYCREYDWDGKKCKLIRRRKKKDE